MIFSSQTSFRNAALALTLFIANGAFAQSQPATTAAPNKDVLKARLAAQEKRTNLLLDEIKAADSRIENQIDDLLKTLRMVGDSKDSRTKISRMKQDTIDKLQRSITYYQQKRAWLQEELRRPTYNLTADEKRRIIARFDERIEKRVNQILDMNKTLPTHQDYERYKSSGDTTWDGSVVYSESEDYKQNQRLSSHTNTQRDKIIKGLQTSIDRLDRQNRSLAELQARSTDPEYRLASLEEQRKNDELLKARRAQLSEVFTAPALPTRPISGSEAQALDRTMQQSIASLRRDLTTFFQRYTVWLGERSSVNNLKAALK